MVMLPLFIPQVALVEEALAIGPGRSVTTAEAVEVQPLASVTVTL